MLVRHYKSKKSVDFFIYPTLDTLFGTVSAQAKQGGIICTAYKVQCRRCSEYGANKPDLPAQQALQTATREGFHSLLYKGARYAGTVSGGDGEEQTE